MPGSWSRQLLAAAFTAAVLLVVVLLGQVPFGRPSDRATLRLALRTVQGKIEVCRDRTPEELAALPAHMRQPRSCDEVAPPYRLRVAIGLRTVLDEQFEPGGLRGDRPIIVDRRLVHSPGKARVQIAFEPVLDEAARRSLAQSGSELPGYALDRQIELLGDRIILVQLDEAAGRLEIYDEPAATVEP